MRPEIAQRKIPPHQGFHLNRQLTAPDVGIMRPRELRPKGILGSCDMALKNDSCSAMGASPDDFTFVVEDVLEEYREAQLEFADMQAPIDKKGAYFFLNQNSREPVTEPDEMVPLWKILHLVGAD